MSDHALEIAVIQALAENRRVHGDKVAAQADDDSAVVRRTPGSLIQQIDAARTARHELGVKSVGDGRASRAAPERAAHTRE